MYCSCKFACASTGEWSELPGKAADTGKGNKMDKSALYACDLSSVTWRKSKRSFVEGQECVEVAELADGAVALRDSRNPTRLDLRFTASEWAAFLDGVRHGEF
jgi:hypothetical protein